MHPSSWIFSSPSCRLGRKGKLWKKDEERYVGWLLGTSEKWVLTKKRRKGLINSSKLPPPSLCQYRDDHNKVYFGDKCLNEKAAPQRAVSFLHIKTKVVVDSTLNSSLPVVSQRFKQIPLFRGTLRDNEKTVDTAYCESSTSNLLRN